MYKVYRCTDGVLSQKIGEFATLAEAYTCAERASLNAESRFVHYRIHGRLPTQSADGREGDAQRFWFVLDNDIPPPQGALRAREVLASLGAMRPGAAAIVGVRRTRSVDATGESEFYRVDRITHGVRSTIRDGFMTEREAHDWLTRWVGKRRGLEENFVIVAPASPPQPSQTQRLNASQTRSDEARSYRVDLVTNGMSHTIRNGIPTRHEAQDFITRWKRKHPNRRAEIVIVASAAQSRAGRRTRDEREGRRDLSLLGRPDYELGLGAPAQWSKGRRNRKGLYIP